MKKIFILPLVFIPGFAFADIASTKYVDDVVNSLNIPAAVTEQTVSGWGFTKNAGTVTKVNDVDPVNGNVTLTIPTVTDTYSADSSDGMSGKAVASAISGKANTSDLKAVATSGSYDDLTNKPTIPTAVTEQTVSGWGFTKNAGTVTKVNDVDPVNGNVTLTIPTVTDTYSADSSDGMSGKAVASAISTKVSIPSGGSAGQVLKKQSDGSIAWADDIDTDTDTNTTYTAGTGISISGTEITNTAISQVRSGGSTSTTLANIWLE